MKRVYLSSTINDLEEFRSAVSSQSPNSTLSDVCSTS